MDFLTAAQAAHRAGVSRPTISRALKAGELPGIRDNSGSWRLDPAEVDAWSRHRASVHAEQRSHTAHAQVQDGLDAQLEQVRTELVAAREQIARLEGQATAHGERLADALIDRDAWKALAERLSARPVEIVEPSLPTRLSLFTRLFKR